MAVIPEGWGEREAKPRSARWPKKLWEQVEEVAKATHHSETDALFHLVQWACDEYRAQKERERLGK